MSDFMFLPLSFAAGILLGIFFFGGLWWSTRKAISTNQPGRWILGSLLLRMAVILAGFYFVGGGHWDRLLLCILGFVVARAVVLRVTKPKNQLSILPIEAPVDAP